MGVFLLLLEYFASKSVAGIGRVRDQVPNLDQDCHHPGDLRCGVFGNRCHNICVSD